MYIGIIDPEGPEKINQQNSEKLFPFKKYFIRIVSLYVCIVLIKIRNIFIKIIFIFSLWTDHLKQNLQQNDSILEFLNSSPK